jgi:hypothetical protein
MQRDHSLHVDINTNLFAERIEMDAPDCNTSRSDSELLPEESLSELFIGCLVGDIEIERDMESLFAIPAFQPRQRAKWDGRFLSHSDERGGDDSDFSGESAVGPGRFD